MSTSSSANKCVGGRSASDFRLHGQILKSREALATDKVNSNFRIFEEGTANEACQASP
jgi:hypothetical protein